MFSSNFMQSVLFKKKNYTIQLSSPGPWSVFCGRELHEQSYGRARFFIISSISNVSVIFKVYLFLEQNTGFPVPLSQPILKP